MAVKCLQLIKGFLHCVLIEKILLHVSKKYSVSVEDIKSKKKTDSIAGARHISIYIIRKLTDLSLKEIGKIFGRDHSTVISSINKIELNIRTVKNYESEINLLIKDIRGV
jgi:chromosomal replication initiator protein